MDAGEPQRDGQQPCRFRYDLRMRRVGAAHDHRQIVERGHAAQAEGLDHEVEGAMVAAMAPEYLVMRHVEGGGIEPAGSLQHIGRRYEQEAGARIDEAADQPWAGDAVDLGPGTGHPDRASLGIAPGQASR